MRPLSYFYLFFLATAVSALACSEIEAQSIDKLKRQAMNTSRLTHTSGDSVATFTLLATEKRSPKAVLEERYWWYGSSKLHSTQGGYSGRLLDGEFVMRNSKGDLLEQGALAKGQRIGEWRSWFPGGAIRGVYHWREGQQHGRFEEYYPTGELQKEGRYNKGSLEGRVKEYTPEGERTITRYRDGKAVAPKLNKERKRFLKAKKAWQKALERAKDLNFLKKENMEPGTESVPRKTRRQKKLERQQQRESREKKNGLRLPFGKKEKVEHAPQG